MSYVSPVPPSVCLSVSRRRAALLPSLPPSFARVCLSPACRIPTTRGFVTSMFQARLRSPDANADGDADCGQHQQLSGFLAIRVVRCLGEFSVQRQCLRVSVRTVHFKTRLAPRSSYLSRSPHILVGRRNTRRNCEQKPCKSSFWNGLCSQCMGLSCRAVLSMVPRLSTPTPCRLPPDDFFFFLFSSGSLYSMSTSFSLFSSSVSSHRSPLACPLACPSSVVHPGGRAGTTANQGRVWTRHKRPNASSCGRMVDLKRKRARTRPHKPQ